jgi:hypothetical protein
MDWRANRTTELGAENFIAHNVVSPYREKAFLEVVG